MAVDSVVGPTCFYHSIIKLRMFVKTIEFKILKIGQIADLFAKQEKKKKIEIKKDSFPFFLILDIALCVYMLA